MTSLPVTHHELCGSTFKVCTYYEVLDHCVGTFTELKDQSASNKAVHEEMSYGLAVVEEVLR